VSIALQIHPATARQLGPAAVAVAKLAASIAEFPDVESWIVYCTPGGALRRGHVRVEPASEAPVTGTVYGVFNASVTLAQLIDELSGLAEQGDPK
jgi:hypothetical protein